MSTFLSQDLRINWIFSAIYVYHGHEFLMIKILSGYLKGLFYYMFNLYSLVVWMNAYLYFFMIYRVFGGFEYTPRYCTVMSESKYMATCILHNVNFISLDEKKDKDCCIDILLNSWLLNLSFC